MARKDSVRTIGVTLAVCSLRYICAVAVTVLGGERDGPRVLFSGTVVANGGDRAIVEAQIDVLRDVRPNLEIDLADNLPVVALRLMPGHRIVPTAFGELRTIRLPGLGGRLARRLNPQRMLLAASLLRRARWLGRVMCSRREFDLLTRIGGYEAVIYCGGTSLVESYWLEPKFFELQLALALNVPVSLMTQSLGPFSRPRVQRAIRKLCSGAKLILLRDQRSLNNLMEVRAEIERCEVLPDIVLSMTDEASVQSIRSRRLDQGALTIAVSVRDLTNYRKYEVSGAAGRYDEAVKQLVTHLVSSGHRVTFLSTCQGVPEYWTDDSRKAQAILNSLAEHVRNGVEVDTSERSTADLRTRLQEFDMVVATRLHAGILALTAGTVVLPIAYEFKTYEVFASLGMDAYILDAETSENAEYINTFERFRRDVDGLRDDIATKLAAVAVQSKRAGAATVRACGI